MAATFIVPLSDYTKTFYIECKTKDDIQNFENTGKIFGYGPFQKYINLFDNTHYYSVSYRQEDKLFGGRIYIYTVQIYQR